MNEGPPAGSTQSCGRKSANPRERTGSLRHTLRCDSPISGRTLCHPCFQTHHLLASLKRLRGRICDQMYGETESAVTPERQSILVPTVSMFTDFMSFVCLCVCTWLCCQGPGAEQGRCTAQTLPTPLPDLEISRCIQLLYTRKT